MTFLYFAHIPFVLLFLAFTIGFVCFNWRDKSASHRPSTRAGLWAERLFKRR
jgi:hypothetical protein